jgi:molybdopterin-guanine dinucleotide biosynthesis protein A
MRIMGAILAGGQARRFGSDKALAMLGDRTLIDHARAALDPHVEAVVICGRADGIADRPEPGLGPLGGINAALHHARAKGFDAVLTTGCDMPAYPAELAAALIGEGAAILKDQPLAGFWPVGLADALDAHLAQDNDRSVRGWMKRVDARIVDRPDILLPNINRPEDLAALARGGRG